jgi:hypothetical protein
MDSVTRDRMITEALCAFSVDVECIVQLVAPRPLRNAARVETASIPWGAPPRFVGTLPESEEE